MSTSATLFVRTVWRTLCSCTAQDSSTDGRKSLGPEDSDSTLENAVPKQISEITTTATTPVERRSISARPPKLANAQLQLHSVGSQYEIKDADTPQLHQPGELLIEVQAIGLNPIDWKSPKYGFGIPHLPFISGREFVGTIVRQSKIHNEDARLGDVVLSVSTDYRDYRRAAFQRYAVASDFNTLRIPDHVPIEQVAGVGVAFVAAAITLGISFGTVFPSSACETGLDLLILARSQPKHSIPEDVKDEVFRGVTRDTRIKKGEWLVIYGASAVTGQIAIQLAKLAGLRVIAVADLERHASRLQVLGADLVVDRHDLIAAEQRILAETNGNVRFVIDTVGKTTAQWCHDLLLRTSSSAHPNTTEGTRNKHLLGLSGVPKELDPSVQGHSLPIKLFHTNAVLGRAIMLWLQEILSDGTLKLPEVDLITGGLKSVNEGLSRLERGEASGKRIVVSIDHR